MVVARLLLATCIAVATLPADADEVVVAVPLSMQPYFVPVADNGLAYDTIRAAFAAQGHSVRPLYVTMRGLPGLVRDASAVDCVPMVSPGLEHDWTRTRGLDLLQDFAITRPNRRLDRMEDLSTGRVLAYRGATRFLGEGFRAAVARNPQYREISNHRAQVKLLLQGSIDVIVADRLLVAWYLDYLKQQGEDPAELVLHDLFEPIAEDFVCRRPEIAAAFDAGLARIIVSGRLADIEADYGARRSRPNRATPEAAPGRAQDGPLENRSSAPGAPSW